MTTRILIALTALTGAVVAPLGVAGAAAPPAGLCTNAPPGRSAIRLLPWAQQAMEPSRVWTTSSGAGVVVAVVDSGVDSDHPQLRTAGKVLAGEDFFQVGKLPANFDCDSHGTAVASIIAASPAGGIGFSGVAPGARILPVRVSERGATDGDVNEIDPLVLAQGIRYAADRGAKVINLSVAGQRDEAPVRLAVAYAQRRDALVIAAVGNGQRADGDSLPSYPAAYDGVIGVGAIDVQGVRLSNSQTGRYVDLVAPGGSVLGATRRSGHAYFSGTSFAAPFVAGTAALVRSAWPQLTAKQVAQRLMATASTAPGGSASGEYGAGVVDPYRAVNEGLSKAAPQAMPSMVDPPADQMAIDARATQQHLTSTAWQRIGVGVGLALMVLLTALLLPGALKNRWTPTRAIPLTVDRVREEPPEQLFLLPKPPSAR